MKCAIRDCEELQNEMEDLISVIVPIYRVEKYLEQCIQSIRNQTYKKLEIILIDDGSDDMCPQICDRHAKADRRIKVIHKKNGGPDSARKAGMRVATGKYVGYVDGDDWIEPEMYEKLIEYAHIYGVDVVESGVIDSWEEIEKKRTAYLPEGCYKGEEFIEKVESRLLYAGVFFEHGVTPYLVTKLFLKKIIEKYQMIEDITNKIQDDTMVALPCVAESKKMYISHDCYYHYKVNGESLKRECRQEEVANLLKCYPDFYRRFVGTRLCSKEDEQIKYYMMYWLLYKSPYVFDKLDRGEFLTQFGCINLKDRIVIYGAGAVGIHLEEYVRKVGASIVCWADRNFEYLQRTLDVCNPKEIVNYAFDYVLIAILREAAVKSAKRDLAKLGVPEKKILWIERKYINNPELLLSKIIC